MLRPSYFLVVLLYFWYLPLEAAELTTMLEVDQAVSRQGNQKTEATARFEYSTSVFGGELTGIVDFRLLGPEAIEPKGYDNAFLSSWSDRWTPNNYLEVSLRELYLDKDFSLGELPGRVRLGKQQVVWGQADGLRLLDVVNPQDFREFILADFNDSRIPLWMINMEIFLDFADLQVLLIPDTSVHRLPDQNATFEFTAPFANLPPGLASQPVTFERPNDDVTDGDVGVRLSLFKNGWDLSLNYLYRFDDFPVFDAALTPHYERTHTIGASASTAIGEVVLRSELVMNTDKYFLTPSGLTPVAEVGYVFGLDWRGLTDTILSFQVFQSILLDKGDVFRDTADTTLTLLARRNFMNESLQLEGLWIYHANEYDHLLRLSATYELSSEVELEVYGDWFSGEPDELFGQFNEQDRIGFRLSYGF